MAQSPRNPIPPDHRVSGAAPDQTGGLQSGLDVGEYLTVEGNPDEPEIEDSPDGGLMVTMGAPAESPPDDPGFYANLAGFLSQSDHDRIVTDLLQHIKEDKEARSKRDEQYEEGIRRTGLGKDAPGGAEFEGASRVVHPMMTEACIDYESRIIKELYPPSGPVKPHVQGVATPDKVARANRVAAHMNWQITKQIKEARGTLETTFTQVPLGGSQFIQQWWDHRLKRPRWAFASVDNMYVPFNAADFASANRKTFADKISEVDLRLLIDQGVYIDIDLPPPSQQGEASKSEQASRKVEGVEEPSTNLDGDRQRYQTMSYLDVTDGIAEALPGGYEKAGSLYPYIFAIDEPSRKLLSMYRNWEANDGTREPIEHWFEFPFLPWRGALSIGFPQIIGGLSAAATGALRALLDSAHANNAQGGIIKKGSGTSGQTVTPKIGEFTEIDTGLETDDIRKVVMPFAMNQPSPVLFQLLGFVVEAGRSVVRTSLDESPTDGATNVPVGTQLSRVEEGLVVFTAVHGRAHEALNRLLGGLFRLNRLYLPERIKVDANGEELLVQRSDYEGGCVVQPVSDPTIYSDQQRWAQLNYIQQRMMVAPQLWKAREVELAGLKLVKWPDPESLLADQPEPHELNAVNENLAMAMGQPVSVFPEQDHMAHIQVALDFMRSPVLGSNPLIAPAFLPAALKHVAEHLLYAYVTEVVATVKHAAGMEPSDLMSKDPDIKRQLDQLLAQASQSVVPRVEQVGQLIMPVVQQAMALMKSMQPPAPVDPAAAAVQAAAAETARKAKADQVNAQQTQVDSAGKLQIQQTANALAAERNQIMREGQQIAAQTKIQTTQMDTDAAAEIAASRSNGSGYTDGGSLTHQ